MTDTLPSTHANCDLTTLIEKVTREHEETRQQVLANAAAGHGPQPWERDWPLGAFDLTEHLSSEAFEPDQGLLGHLLTMVSWALASPLGRQALLADGQATNPGQHTLNTLREFRTALVARRRELLCAFHGDDSETWCRSVPLGDFHLLEHLTCCPEFTPDWFTTGELIEIADWALASEPARQLNWDDPLERQAKLPVVEVIQQFGEGLAIRRRRLLLEQAEHSLGYQGEQLKRLKANLGP